MLGEKPWKHVRLSAFVWLRITLKPSREKTPNNKGDGSLFSHLDINFYGRFPLVFDIFFN